MKRSHLSEQQTVSIANLKAKLAYYLRRVRAGKEVIITEHNRPVARLVQIEPSEGLRVLPAQRPFEDVASIQRDAIQPGAIDSLSHLLEERGKR